VRKERKEKGKMRRRISGRRVRQRQRTGSGGNIQKERNPQL
jgi:hypothetical protein